MQKKHSNRLLRSIEYGSVMLFCVTLLGLMGCGDDPAPLSSEKQITAFSIATQSGAMVSSAPIDHKSRAIVVTIDAATVPDIKWLVPAISVSDKASVSPASDVPQNFFGEESVVYTVTAQDGSTQEYKVLVVVKEPPKPSLTIDLAGTDKRIVIYSTPDLVAYGTAGVTDTVRLSLTGKSNTTTNPAGTVVNNKEAVVSIKVSGATDNSWSVTDWAVDGRTGDFDSANSNIITLKASNYFIGRHSVTFTVMVNGKPYSEQFYFVVDK